LVLIESALEHAKQEALDWLLKGEKLVEKSFSKINEKVKVKTSQRIQAYHDKLKQLRQIEEQALLAFGKDVWKKKLTELKRDINSEREVLVSEVNRPMREAMEFAFKVRLTAAQRARGTPPVPETRPWTLWWIDRVTMWGLLAVGVCLMLGLLTRTACIAGAGFLLMFYLAMPSLPWLPVNPRAEGHYVFINKNIIEMLALLALATTTSGRWAGIDGLIHYSFRGDLQPQPNSVTTQRNAEPAPP